MLDGCLQEAYDHQLAEGVGASWLHEGAHQRHSAFLLQHHEVFTFLSNSSTDMFTRHELLRKCNKDHLQP